jgi:parallel beta-helix repeat protein
MTVQKVSNYLVYCLAADTKPTNMANNTLAYETDTGDIYKSSSGSWTLMTTGNTRDSLTRPYTYFIYKSGSTYYAKSGDSIASPTISSNSDFKTLIQAVISGISPAGTPTRIIIGAGDFNLASQFSIPQSALGNITIEGMGMGLTNIIITSAWNGITIGTPAIKIGDLPTIAAGNTGTLTANCAVRTTTCTMSTTDAAKFAAGDYVLLTSSLAYSTAPTAATPQAETKRVFSVNTGTGVVTFDVPTFDTYNTANSAKLYKVTAYYLFNIRIANMTIKKGSGLNTDTGNTTGVCYMTAYNVENLDVDSVELIDPVTQYDGGLSFKSILNSRIRNCHLLFNSHTNTYNDQYGIAIGNCSQSVVISDCNAMGRFRHPFELANDATGAGQQGVIRNVTAANCTVNGSEIAGFSTHTGGENISFFNCRVLGSTQSTGNIGFEVRARKSQIIGCSAIGAITYGIQFSGDAHDGIISNSIVKGCLTDGIRLINDLSGVKRTTICNNTVAENGNNGIRLDSGCDYTNIHGNLCNSNVNNGMYLKDSDYLNVSNNTVTNNTSNGIWVDPATLTLSNNVVTNNILSGNGSASMTFATSSTGTWGAANIVDNNMGYTSNVNPATTTFSNKSLAADTNTLSGVFQDTLMRRVGYLYPGTSGTSVMVFGGIITGGTVPATGTNSFTFDTTEGTVAVLASTTTINQNIGLISQATTSGITRRSVYTRARMRNKVDAVASSVSRLYFGFTSASALPISDTPLATTDSGIIVGFSSTDTTYQIYANDGATSVTKTTVTGSISKNTNFHTIEINWAASGNVNVIFDGVSQTISTDLPATTTALNFNAVVQNATAATRQNTVKGIWIETG